MLYTGEEELVSEGAHIFLKVAKNKEFHSASHLYMASFGRRNHFANEYNARTSTMTSLFVVKRPLVPGKTMLDDAVVISF